VTAPRATAARQAFVLFATAAAWFTVPAFAQDLSADVTIHVLDTDGRVVPSAVVRHPLERELHRVNADNGTWKTDAFYFEGDRVEQLERGMTLTLEISAPGFRNAELTVLLRRRHNRFRVKLEPMTLQDETQDPLVEFGRDRPFEGRAPP
jgi:hypothetical protein